MSETKYALVDFFQRNEVDIVETKDIITNVKRTKLNAKDWNGETQVQVLWFPDGPTGKKPPKKYVAKVLRFEDERNNLLPFRKAAEEGLEVPATGELEYGRGKRKHDKRDTSSEESDAETVTDVRSKRKQKKTKAAARHKAAEHAKKLLMDSVTQAVEHCASKDSSTPTVGNDLAADVGRDQDQAENVSTLQQQVAALQTENESLRNTIAIMQGLPSLLQQVQKLSTALKNVPDRAAPAQTPAARSLNLPASTPLRVANDVLPRTPVARAPGSVTAHAGCRRRVFDYEVDDDNKVDLGYGVVANADNLQYVSRLDVKKTTYTICEVLFTKEELAGSSLTGKKSNAFQDVAVKEKLDDSKVRAIIDFTMKMHPAASEGDVKKAIAAKLNIAQKIVKSKKE